ncbi:LuxR C-terminal-related transcriptional regulator [Reinekea sp.]|jgi:DNA-binding NarL/FixJ family response regulator|uniref:LuxR C-terminal-related transcriptional regulator n=1 Tax=Reinekea sp. TaxID=1970455 RepID=UPI003989D53C
MHKLLIVDDHPLFRDALNLSLNNAAQLLQLSPENPIYYSASLEDAFRQLALTPNVDLIMLDLHLPGHDGFWGLVELRKLYPAISVIVISGNDESETIAKAKACGASGFISKSAMSSYIVDGVHAVLKGDEYWPEGSGDVDSEVASIAKKIHQLTEQQLVVLKHLQEGRLNKQIAYDLEISEATVKAHVTAIFRKLGVVNRTQAVILANKLQIDAPLAI